MSNIPPINNSAAHQIAGSIEQLSEMLRDTRSDIVDAFLLGASEFRASLTTRLDTEEEREAYDEGRAWAHKTTLSYFEEGNDE